VRTSVVDRHGAGFVNMRVRVTTLPEPPAALLAELTASAVAVAGMAPAILDRRAVRQTLRRRIEATTAGSVEEYVVLYRESTEERSSFLEGILNNETCFFRDTPVFEAMRQWCAIWFAANNRTMRILSAPCSTGEEPYSITAMLCDAGFPLERFTVDAIDLSSAALEIAKQAEYTGLALRNVPNPEEATYFERGDRGWRVRDALRRQVHFRQGNLLDDGLLEAGAYDLICSRNLLIYQTLDARKRVAAVLARALHPQGRMVLGAADWGRDLDSLFELEAPIHSFSLRLRTQPAAAMKTPEAPKSADLSYADAYTSRTARHITTSDDLARVTEIYRRALEAFASSNEREAERMCRQALYLDNDHLPSLELLTKVRRPNLTHRMQHALRARLRRHRAATQEGAA